MIDDAPPGRAGVTLRFAQLAIGARFVYRGRQYQKVSPLEALVAGTDSRQLIPRSSKVEPLVANDAAVQAPSAGGLVDARVRRAVAECMDRLHRRLTEHYPPTDPTQNATLATLLQSAHDDLLTRLGSTHRLPDGEGDASTHRQEK